MRKLLLATTILSGVSLAIPVMAQEAGVGADAGVGASAGTGSTGVGADSGVGADAAAGVGAGADVGGAAGVGTDGQADASAGVSATGSVAAGDQGIGSAALGGRALGSVDAQLVMGSPVVSSDGAEIGTVTDLTTDANGQGMVTVDLTDDLGVDINAIRMRAEHTAFVNQQVRLNTTRASFVSSVQAQLGAEASGG